MEEEEELTLDKLFEGDNKPSHIDLNQLTSHLKLLQGNSEAG